jgi:ABC-type sugar transport system ATPase subunit
VLVISSEFDELKSCDRVVVLREGRVSADLGPDEVSEAAVLAASFADHTDLHPAKPSRETA